MTNVQQADMTMFAAVKKELADDSGAYDGDEAMQAAADAFNEANDVNLAAAAAAHPDNSGYSEEKNNNKLVLAKLASNLCGRAFVTLSLQNKTSIAAQLSIFPTNYSSLADSPCASLAQKVHDVMSDNIGDLTGYVTAAKLVEFQKAIDHFKELQGTSDYVHEVSPELTEDFEDSFVPVKEKVEHLKLLVRDYEITNNAFYKRLMASTVVPTVNVHHTYVAIYAYSKETQRPLENITFTLTKGKKSAITDWEGNALIAEVRSGKDVLTATIGDENNPKILLKLNIKIIRAKSNFFKIAIEGLG
jgi:hypothetical protein